MLALAAPVMVRSARSASLLVAMVAIGACSSGERKAPDSPVASRTAAPAPAPALAGDADRDFLRMMSDHHKGLIVMAHMTKDRRQGGRVVTDAKRLDAKQDAELDKMVSMLETTYKDPYAPRVMPEHQAMADKLKIASAADYDRTFYESVIAHHAQALAMVDAYLPHAKSAVVKQLAETMKAGQAREIAEFQRRVRLR